MKRKKAVAFLMAMGLTFSVALTGCGNSGGSPDQETVEKQAEKETESGVSESDDQSAKTSEEIAELELVVGHAVIMPEKEDNFLEKKIRDAIGVDVTMNILGAGSDYTTALNARISGGDIPDMFQAPSTDALMQYVENGLILCLDDYLDQLQPLVDWVGGENGIKPNRIGGKLYRVPKAPQGIYDLLVVRQDWLDKVGAEVPTTMEEALEVARKLTFDDPDGNGVQDTYGFSGSGLFGFNAILTSYGGATTNELYLSDKGLTSTLLSPRMKEGLEMCKRFVDAGVVDPDIVANNPEVLRDKMAQCKIGMASYDWANMYKQINWDLITAVDPGADWIWMNPWDAQTGETPRYHIKSAVNTIGSWVISADVADNPEKLDAVLKLLNYVVSEEGNRLVCYGEEGRHYNVEDGMIVKTDLMTTECEYIWLYQIASRNEMEYLSVKFPEAEGSIKAAMETDRIVTYTEAVIMPEDFHMEDMNKYIEENIIGFIFGTRPISEYDQFIEELNTSFGFGEYMKIAEEQLKEQGYME